MIRRRDFLTLAGAASLAALAPSNGSTHARGETKPSPAADPQFPRYHFRPPANWMNDPNGPIHWKGFYHMFYQYNPHAAYWGDMHWGHARSRDLVHWEHLPMALAPTPGGPDKDGCFSGCAVINQGVPTFVYTGVNPEVQCLATSDDAMIEWKKYPGNPVIAVPPQGLDTVGFRDPAVWRQGNSWRMVIGSGLKGAGGAALLYQSSDLIHWDYLNPLATGKMDQGVKVSDPVDSGEMWECPDFFPLGDRHVLLVSTKRLTFYFTGHYDGPRLAIEQQGHVDFGSYYACRSMLDASGHRRILWGWITERRSKDAQVAAGWSGAMSLPRVIGMGGDHRLEMRPAEELEALRGRHYRESAVEIAGGATLPLNGIQGDGLEIAAEFDPGDAQQVGLIVRRSPDSSEQTVIGYDKDKGQLAVDTNRSSLNQDGARLVLSGSLTLPHGQPLRLRIFLDRSVVEVFGNERACLTDRIYPTRPDSVGIALFARGGRARLSSLEAWEMKSIV